MGPLLIAAAIYLLFIANPDWWNIVIWPHAMARYGLPFADMQGHLASSRAFADGTLVPGEPVSGDPVKRIHGGPTWMLWLGFLGFGPEHTYLLTALSLAGFLLTLGLTLRPEHGREALLLFLVLTGPPLMLLVERGNIDLLVYIALAGAFAALGARAAAGRWSGWALIGAFIGFKYYPALAFASLTEARASRREKWITLGLGAAAVAGFILWSLAEIRYVSAHQVENRFFPFFGSREILVMIGQDHATAARLSLVVWLAITTGLARLFGPFTASESGFDARKIPFVGGGAIVLFCFVVTTSPDYRLVFLLFCLPWLCALSCPGCAASRSLRMAAGLCLLLVVLTPWFGTLGARAALAVESARLWWAVLFLKQLSWWTLTTCLGALLARLLMVRTRELLNRRGSQA